MRKILLKALNLFLSLLILAPSFFPSLAYAQSSDYYWCISIAESDSDRASCDSLLNPRPEEYPPPVEISARPPPEAPAAETITEPVQQIQACQDHQVVHNSYVSCYSSLKCHYDTLRDGPWCITYTTAENPYCVDASQQELEQAGCINPAPAPQPEPAPAPAPEPASPAQSVIDWQSVIRQSCDENPYPGSECENYVSNCGRGKESAFEYNRCLIVFIREQEVKAAGGLGLLSEAEVSDPANIDYAALQPIIDATSQANALGNYGTSDPNLPAGGLYREIREGRIDPNSALGRLIDENTPFGPAVPEGFQFATPAPSSCPSTGSFFDSILSCAGQNALVDTGQAISQAPGAVGGFINQVVSGAAHAFGLGSLDEQADYERRLEEARAQALSQGQPIPNPLVNTAWEQIRQKVIAAGGNVEGNPDDFTITLPGGKKVKPNSPEAAEAEIKEAAEFLENLGLTTANLITFGYTGLVANVIDGVNRAEANREKITQLDEPASSVENLLTVADKLKLASTASSSEIDEIASRTANHPFARAVYLAAHPEKDPNQVTDGEVRSDIDDRVRAWQQRRSLERENVQISHRLEEEAIAWGIVTIPGTVAAEGAGQAVRAAAGNNPIKAVTRFLRTGSFKAGAVETAAEGTGISQLGERSVAQVIKDGKPAVVSNVDNVTDVVTTPKIVTSTEGELNAAEVGREVLIKAGVPEAELAPANLTNVEPSGGITEEIKKIFGKIFGKGAAETETETETLKSLIAAANHTEKLTPGQIETNVANALDGLNGVTEQKIKEQLVALGYPAESVDATVSHINNLLIGADVRKQGAAVVHINDIDLSAQTQIGGGKFGTVLVDEQKTVATKLFKGNFVEPNSPNNLNEIRLLQTADGAGGLPKILSVVTDDNGVIGFQMEYIPGKTLKQLVQQGGSITRAEAEQLVRSLEEIYEKTATLHGDLHLDNIIVQETVDSSGVVSRQLRIVDYGGGPILPNTITKRILDLTHGYEVDGVVAMVLQTFKVDGNPVRLLNLSEQEAKDFVRTIVSRHYDDDLAKTVAEETVALSNIPKPIKSAPAKTLTDETAESIIQPTLITAAVVRPTEAETARMEQVVLEITDQGRDAAGLTLVDSRGVRKWGNQSAWTIDDIHTPEARNPAVIKELNPEAVSQLNPGDNYNYIVAVDPKSGETKILICREVDNCKHISLAGEAWQVRTDIPSHAAADPAKKSEYIARPDIKIVRSGTLTVDNQGRIFVDLESGYFSNYGDVIKYPGWSKSADNFGKVEDIFQGVTGIRPRAVSMADAKNWKFDPQLFLKEVVESDYRALERAQSDALSGAKNQAGLTVDLTHDPTPPKITRQLADADARKATFTTEDGIKVTEKEGLEDLQVKLKQYRDSAEQLGMDKEVAEIDEFTSQLIILGNKELNEATRNMAARIAQHADNGKTVVVFVYLNMEDPGSELYIAKKVLDHLSSERPDLKGLVLLATHPTELADFASSFNGRMRIVINDDVSVSGSQMQNITSVLKGALQSKGLTSKQIENMTEINLLATDGKRKTVNGIPVNSYYELPTVNLSGSGNVVVSSVWSSTDFQWQAPLYNFVQQINNKIQSLGGNIAEVEHPLLYRVQRPYKMKISGGYQAYKPEFFADWEKTQAQYQIPSVKSGITAPAGAFKTEAEEKTYQYFAYQVLIGGNPHAIFDNQVEQTLAAYGYKGDLKSAAKKVIEELKKLKPAPQQAPPPPSQMLQNAVPVTIHGNTNLPFAPLTPADAKGQVFVFTNSPFSNFMEQSIYDDLAKQMLQTKTPISLNEIEHLLSFAFKPEEIKVKAPIMKAELDKMYAFVISSANVPDYHQVIYPASLSPAQQQVFSSLYFKYHGKTASTSKMTLSEIEDALIARGEVGDIKSKAQDVETALMQQLSVTDKLYADYGKVVAPFSDDISALTSGEKKVFDELAKNIHNDPSQINNIGVDDVDVLVSQYVDEPGQYQYGRAYKIYYLLIKLSEDLKSASVP